MDGFASHVHTHSRPSSRPVADGHPPRHHPHGHHDGDEHHHGSERHSKWQVIADKVVPHGVSTGLDAATHIAALTTLTRVLHKPSKDRNDADIR